MPMPDQLLTERFNQLTPQYQQFITGTFVDHTTSILATEAGLNEEQREMFRNAVTLYLLCFFDVSEAVNFLSTEANLNVQDASPLIGAVINTLPEGMATNQETIYNALNGIEVVKESVTHEVAQVAPVPQPQIPESPVSPVRTMAADMQQAKDETTYTSSQDHILNQPAAAPTPTSPDDARWQSPN